MIYLTDDDDDMSCTSLTGAQQQVVRDEIETQKEEKDL